MKHCSAAHPHLVRAAQLNRAATELLWIYCEEKGAYVSSRPHQIVLVTASCNGQSRRVQMTAAIAVEGEARPDIRRNGCNQVGDAVLVGAEQFAQ
jgi:hypothetical protein